MSVYIEKIHEIFFLLSALVVMQKKDYEKYLNGICY